MRQSRVPSSSNAARGVKDSEEKFHDPSRLKAAYAPGGWLALYGPFLLEIGCGHAVAAHCMIMVRAWLEFDRMYLVGSGTHPGSGLPVIFESARTSSQLLLEDLSPAA